MSGLHFADYLALGSYFALVAAIGLWTLRGVHDLADFVMPHRFGRMLMVFFGFGAGTHSDQAVSVAAKSYTNGASGIWYQWLWLFVTPFYWLIAPMMRRFRALTTGDVFELRYGRSVGMLFAVVGLMQYAVNIGVMLKGSAHVIEGSTGGQLSASWAIPAVTVLFVAYGMAGGLHAAVWTDFVQGVLTVVFSFLLLPFLLEAIGGFAGLHAALPASKLTLVAPEEIGIFYVAIIALNGLVGIVAQPHTMSNCAAGRTELDGQVGFVCGNFLKRICTIAWTLTGLGAIAYFSRQGLEIDPDNVFGEVAYRFLPAILPGLLGLFLAGLLAAVMSTCDAYMIATAGLFTNNIYRPLRPDRSEQHYLCVARLSSLGVVAAGVSFAYWLPSVVTGLEIFWKISPMLGLAFWLGLFWRRMTAAGAWASTLAAFGTWWLTSQPFAVRWIAALPFAGDLRLIFTAGGQAALYLPWQMVSYLLAGLIAGVLVSLITPRRGETELERFYALVRTPVTEGEETPAPCTLPAGARPRPRRKLIPLKSWEVYIPSRQLVLGFLASWLGVAILIAIFLWLIAPPAPR